MRFPRPSLRAAGLALCLAGLGACRGGFEGQVRSADRAVLAAPDHLEILALDPESDLGVRPIGPGEDALRGYRVLGRAVVEDPAERAALLALVRRGIDAADDRVAACFLPRHGLRARRGERTVDLVICYQCLAIHVHGADGARTFVRTSAGVEPEVSALYRARGLTLAPR